jgi:hypothetical protein
MSKLSGSQFNPIMAWIQRWPVKYSTGIDVDQSGGFYMEQSNILGAPRVADTNHIASRKCVVWLFIHNTHLS